MTTMIAGSATLVEHLGGYYDQAFPWKSTSQRIPSIPFYTRWIDVCESKRIVIQFRDLVV